MRRLTGGEGVDVVLDPVGGKYTEQAVRSLRWNGRLLVVGFAANQEIPKLPLNLLLLKQARAIGVYWGAWAGRNPKENARHLDELFSLYRHGRLTPCVGATYRLEDTQLALEDMGRRAVLGKAVVTLNALAQREALEIMQAEGLRPVGSSARL